MRPQVLVVGDDLTGSNATGGRFARSGLRTISVSGVDRLPPAGDADVLVVNAGTRQCATERARERVRETVRSVAPVELVSKRIDTTLRGNVGAEIDAVLDALEPGVRALVVPAFPDAGRTTVGGLHLVDGVPLVQTSAAQDPLTPVSYSRVASILGQGTAKEITEVPLDVVESGTEALAHHLARASAPILVCDAVNNAHLNTIAEAAARERSACGTSWVSVDSGPFAVLLSAALGVGSGTPRTAPVLAVVGSVTSTTSEQVLELEEVLRARFVEIPPDGLDAGAIAEQVTGMLRPWDRVAGVRMRVPEPGEPLDPLIADRVPGVLAEAAARLLSGNRFDGLYVTGGDIAEATTAALGSDGFAIETEVLPLAVAGRLIGGAHDGLPFATKGGLIGDRGAAVSCVEHLINTSERSCRTK